MRVLFNGVSALKPKTGVGHTTANLHKTLVHLRPHDTFWLYPGAWLGAVAARALRPRPQKNPAPASRPRLRAVRGAVKAVAKGAYRTHFQTAARWGGFDLYHEPNFVAVGTPLPTVVTVHDLSVLLHPQWHPADRVRFHEHHFRRGIGKAAHVVVVSESVRRECVTVLGLDPARVTAVPNGIGSEFRPQPPAVVEALRRRRGLPERYLLSVGTIEPRKNLVTLMRAYCDLPPGVRAGCPLVVGGGWGWRSDAERAFYETEGRHKGVIHIGYVSDADLPALYAGATALLYPSHYEGFGLPPVEMLAAGGCVVASTATAVREVMGTHAHFVEPLDAAGWREAMRRVITEPDFADQLRRGGVEHAGRFTWERAAASTFAAYERVLGVARPTPAPAPSARAAA